MANKFYVGDYGTDIIVECGEDISGATGTVIKYRKPDNKTGEWVATIYDNPDSQYDNSCLKYTVEDGDWDLAGTWFINAFMSLTGWTGHGETDSFMLHEPGKET